MSERLPRQTTFWIFHHQLHLNVVSLAGLGLLLTGALVSPVSRLAGLLLILVGGLMMWGSLTMITVAIVSAFRHDRPTVICRWCGSEQAKAPERRVEESRRTLWWWHHRVPMCSGLIVLGVGSLIFGIVVLGFSTSFTEMSPGEATLATVLTAPTVVGVIVLLHVERVHRLLRPWCPYCRGWDEGGTHEPSPDPAGTKEQV